MIMTHKMKALMIGLGVVAVIALSVLVVNLVRAPKQSAQPSPVPASSPVTPEIFETTTDACSLSFTVAPPELVPGLNCENKKIYKDDPDNVAGDYVLAGNELISSTKLEYGKQYVYVINYKNSGTGAVGGEIVDKLPTGTSFVDGSSGCKYSAGDVTCPVDTVDASSAGYVAIRIKVASDTTATSFKNSAVLTPDAGESSTCTITNAVSPVSPVCNDACNETNLLCASDQVCYYEDEGDTTGLCRNPTCKTEADCTCPLSSSSPKSSPSDTPAPSDTPKTPDLSCIVKRVYEDDSRNSAGTYYLNNEITDTNTLTNGQTIVYNVVASNGGGATSPDVKITDKLSTNLTFVDASTGCSYDGGSRVVTCDLGDIGANTQASKSIRVKIGVAGKTSIANTAEVFSSNGQTDSCSISVSATGEIVQPPSPVPSTLPEAGVFEITAGTLGLGLVLLLLGGLGLLLL